MNSSNLKAAICNWLNPKQDFFLINATCLSIALIGIIFGVLVLLTTYFAGETYSKELCFTNECFGHFFQNMSSSFTIFETTGKITLGIFAFGSFGVACKNYVNNKTSTNNDIYLSHINLFIGFCEKEAVKKDELDLECISLMQWYNLAYNDSREGSLEISKQYHQTLEKIENCIQLSNNEFYGPETSNFDYKQHQTRMIECFSHIGINLNRRPRLKFYEVETQALELINTINASFCKITNHNNLSNSRKYC